MNWGKRILTVTALLGVLGSMSACSKGSDSTNGTAGNISMNGTTSTATDNVNGYPISVTISSMGYYPGMAGGQLTANGYPLSLQSMSAANYMQYGPQQITVGQYVGKGVTLCATSAADPYGQLCQTTATIIWLQPNQYGYANDSMPYMQVGILRYADGSIHASYEKVGCGYGTQCMSSVYLSSAVDVMTWLTTNAR